MLADYHEYGLSILNGTLSVLAAYNARKIATILWPSTPSYSSCITGILVYAAILPSSLALMESAAAIFILSAALLSLLTRSALWGVIATLLPLTRPECLLLLPILITLRMRDHRWNFSIVEMLLPTSLLCALGGWYLSVFGVTIPHSIIAKSVVYQITFQQFWKFFFLGFSGSNIPLFITSLWLVIFLLLIVASIWRYRSVNDDKGSSLGLSATLLLFPLALIIAYASRKVLIFPWYVPLISVPVLVTLTPLWQKKMTLNGYVALFGTLPFMASGIFSVLILFIPEYSVFGRSGARATTLRKIGEVLASTYPASSILAPEIGGLGRGFPGDIVDGAGLASPNSLRYHPLRIPEQRSAGYLGSVPPELIHDAHPDFIVGLPTLLEAVIRAPEISDYVRIDVPIAYTPPLGVQRPIHVWGNKSVAVFARTSLAQTVRDKLLDISN